MSVNFITFFLMEEGFSSFEITKLLSNVCYYHKTSKSAPGSVEPKNIKRKTPEFLMVFLQNHEELLDNPLK